MKTRSSKEFRDVRREYEATAQQFSLAVEVLQLRKELDLTQRRPRNPSPEERRVAPAALRPASVAGGIPGRCWSIAWHCAGPTGALTCHNCRTLKRARGASELIVEPVEKVWKGKRHLPLTWPRWTNSREPRATISASQSLEGRTCWSSSVPPRSPGSNSERRPVPGKLPDVMHDTVELPLRVHLPAPT